MKRHSTDMISLFFGLVFAAIATWWIFGTTANVAETAGWLGIGLLVVFGLVGLVSAAARRDTPAPAPAPLTAPADPFATTPLSATPVSAEPLGATPVSPEPVSAEPVSAEDAEDTQETQDSDTIVITDPGGEHEPRPGDTRPLPAWGEPEGEKP